MVFSSRERYVGMAVAAAVAVFALDRYLLSPYLASVEKLERDQQQVTADLEQDDLLFRRQRELRQVWSQMRTSGALVFDTSEAELQLATALSGWAEQTGVRVDEKRGEQPVREGDFYRIGYRFVGGGSTAAVSKFLWLVETSRLPIRVNDLTLNPRRENTDDVTIRMTVSTLSTLPTADATEAAGSLRASTNPAGAPNAPATRPTNGGQS